MVDGQGRGPGLEVCECAQRHRAAAGRADINVLRLCWIALELWQRFENHVVLIQLREERGDLPLAEGVIKRVIYRLRRDAEPRGGYTINDEPGLRTERLLVGRHIAQLREDLKFCDQLRGPGVQLARVSIFER